MLLLLDRLVQRHLRAHAVETDVDADSIEPRPERRLTLEIPEAAKRPEEDILREVAGILVVADETIAKLIDRSPMTFDDDIERTGQARQTGGHELGLAEVCQRRVPERNIVVSDHCQFPARIRASD